MSWGRWRAIKSKIRELSPITDDVLVTLWSFGCNVYATHWPKDFSTYFVTSLNGDSVTVHYYDQERANVYENQFVWLIDQCWFDEFHTSRWHGVFWVAKPHIKVAFISSFCTRKMCAGCVHKCCQTAFPLQIPLTSVVLTHHGGRTSRANVSSKRANKRSKGARTYYCAVLCCTCKSKCL